MDKGQRVEFTVNGGTIQVYVTTDGKLSVSSNDGHAIAVQPRGANSVHVVLVPFQHEQQQEAA